MKIRQLQLNIIRSTKRLLLKIRIHKILNPITEPLLTLLYLSKLSKWISENPAPQFNDFYSPQWNYGKRYELYKHLFETQSLENKQINYLEFGVANGDSFKWWVQNNTHPQSRFCGFDTFEGLPEDWTLFKAGAMKAPIPNLTDPRASFYKGLFQDTLPTFLKNTPPTQALNIIHLDADLYSSTLYTLAALSEHLQPNDIVLFDEFAVPRHEFLAFLNYTQSHYKKMELIAAANNYMFCAFKIQ